MAKESKSKTSSQKKRLEKELVGRLPEIMEEGLVFLIKQADTIIHNQRAARLNGEINELNRKKGPVVGAEAAGFDVEISRAENGKTYYFVVNGRKHFFDIPETQKVVALCYRPETKSAALKFLFEFFLNERDEILLEHEIKSEKSLFFEELFREVRANFSLQD
jgi:YHS domain-containing protein